MARFIEVYARSNCFIFATSYGATARDYHALDNPIIRVQKM